MALNVASSMAWSTVMAFRHGKSLLQQNSCKLCGSESQGVKYFSITTNHQVRRRNNSFRFRRRVPKNTNQLLEHFIKQTNVDGSLVAKAPFKLSCSASFFDKENNINFTKNREVELSRDQWFKEEKIRRRSENSADKIEESISDDEPDNQEPSSGIFIEVPDIDKDTPEREILKVEQRILDQLSSQSQNNIVNYIYNRTRSPLHFKLFGSSHLRVDSYSIMKQSAHSSHIYISDVGSLEDVVQLITENGEKNEGKFLQSGSISIWRPKQVIEGETTDNVLGWNSEEELVSALKIYTPQHIADDSDMECGLKGVFLCPTLMNKIYMEGEKHACLDLNGKLMDQLVSVGLCAEYGTLRVRDTWAQEINLASRFGDIICEGTVEGNITAEIFGDGDFTSSITVGTKLKVTTDSGDISLWNDCFADLAELYTVTGHVHLRYLYGCGKILVKDQGTVSANVVEGSLAVVVKSGSIYVSVDKLTEDSFLEVETGDITLTLPPNFPFRLSVVGSNNDIAPDILNSGEYFLSGDGKECFVSGVSGQGELQPSISVRSHHGRVILQTQEPVKGRKQRRQVEL